MAAAVGVMVHPVEKTFEVKLGSFVETMARPEGKYGDVVKANP